MALRKAVSEVIGDAGRVRDLDHPMEYTELRDSAFEMLAVVEAVPALLARLNEAEGTVRDVREVATRMLAEAAASQRGGGSAAGPRGPEDEKARQTEGPA
jgi:hypothetical protein